MEGFWTYGRARRAARSRRRMGEISIAEQLESRFLLAAHILGSSAVYSTIQAAVNAAAPGATISVDPGTYPEMVTINKRLTLHGAQAGVDARTNTRAAATVAGTESILTGTNLGGSQSSSFNINANDVMIDGFVVQGNTSTNVTYGAGIVIGPGVSGTHILNNIIQNNVSGLFLANASSTDPAIIQYNLFRNNNNPGANGGRGIYTDGEVSGGNLTNVLIDSNAFINNHGTTNTTWEEAACAFESATANSQSNIRITNNMMDQGDGKGVLFFNASNILIQGNVVTDTTDQWSAALRFEGNVSNCTIKSNTVYDNTGPAVRIDSKGFPGDSSGFAITNNNFYSNSTAYGTKQSMVVAGGQYDGTLDATNNWWGSPSGPGGDGPGTGDTISTGGNSVVFSPWATAPATPADVPYWGIAAQAGSPIQAEDYDHGGEGIAYHDLEAKNLGYQYRPLEGVDIGKTADVGGGFTLGWTYAGEWVNYTVNLAQGGAYNFDFRVASFQSTSPVFHVEADGTNVTGPISVPNTRGWDTWTTVTAAGINLTSGTHVLRFVFDANGSSGNGPNINWFQLTNTTAISPPAAPSNLTASATTNAVNLAWQDNSTNETGFKIERSTDGVNFTQLGTVGSNVTTYTDNTVTSGTTYTYRVRATNAGGDSAPSNTAGVTISGGTTVTYLSDMNWVSATNGWGPVERDMSVGGSGAGDGHTLTLNGVTYAKGLGVNAVSQIVYNVGGGYSDFLCDVGVDDEEAVNGTVNFQVLADGKLLFDSGTMTPTSPTFSLDMPMTGVQQLTLICGDAGDGPDYDHGDWAGARLVSSSTPAAPVVPIAPSNLTATAVSSSQINLTWKDNSANESGFKIQRSTAGTTFTTVATVAQNTTTYSDSGLSAGTAYSYRVIATNSAGDSAASNTASATTQSAAATTIFLSDMAWTSATVGWGTIQKDRSIKGNPITLRGVSYAKGIGTHAVSQIVYNLAGQYSTFISDVGVDDETNGQGAVDFQVLGDGKVLFDSGVLTGTSPVVSINISVASVQQLTLVANNGVAGSIDYDHADWAGARLIANPPAAAKPAALAATTSASTTTSTTATKTAITSGTGTTAHATSQPIAVKSSPAPITGRRIVHTLGTNKAIKVNKPIVAAILSPISSWRR